MDGIADPRGECMDVMRPIVVFMESLPADGGAGTGSHAAVVHAAPADPGMSGYRFDRTFCGLDPTKQEGTPRIPVPSALRHRLHGDRICRRCAEAVDG
ncbi:hypothetical protein [Kitasatospora sp. NPDC059571]|uniref:hypothetical protein n=1 Tax=Kitasatospora sp. NPDC059571 TaxID=3346871 RepID=UPI0036C4CC7D